ncbi:MAG: hypothetical protein A2637_02000 [Candidatus Muproteobacteria bacterium RIFCSPHIGHO2_01_FULL_65_16]|uniref:Uncharacterized protein n=1 Tax=Candidatus Muproteobacteria bacterium RIFCSPHIGHO2_01_FULL_65_16 TaxID=1817764 RepID=A0A1F6TFD3_9PROT|nr:MAG: hypothetical protein A2637_02000 [Candidatus Muproteobacteria bacterium RIFCSPHIGHO2_01_FULL_65_16]
MRGTIGREWPLPADSEFTEVGTMLKWGLWLGTPSLITFLASTYSSLLDNIVFIFILSVAALLVAILPLIYERAKR